MTCRICTYEPTSEAAARVHDIARHWPITWWVSDTPFQLYGRMKGYW